MEFNAIQVLLVFIVGFICGIDQFSFLESLYQPIVTGAVIGLILGDVQTGLIIGGTYQLMTIGNMPVGGAQPPNAVIGGIMAAVLGISMKVDANTAVGLAIPFSLLGQYGVTLIFTIMSPVMTKADACAHNADTKGIERINLFADCTVQARISRVESCHSLTFAFGLFHNINHLLQRHGCTVIYHTALFFQIQQCRIDKRTCINDNVRLTKQLLSSYRNQIRGSGARSNKMYHLFFPLFFYNNQ